MRNIIFIGIVNFNFIIGRVDINSSIVSVNLSFIIATVLVVIVRQKPCSKRLESILKYEVTYHRTMKIVIGFIR